jgi:hypothetical protein
MSHYSLRSLLMAAAFFSAAQINAQTTIARWTFETSIPSTAGPHAAEQGAGSVLGFHAGTTTYSNPVGNGSAESFSSNGWQPGDYYQFSVSTLGASNISISFNQLASSTGPREFYLAHSTDGANFTQFGAIYVVTNNPSWSSSSSTSLNSYSFDLTSVTAINNKSTVYFRLVSASTVSSSGGIVASTGTCRIDNVAVTYVISGPPEVVGEPQNTNTFFGDTVSFSVSVSGTAPLSYQWYHPDLATPLVDGPSGFGSGTISGVTNSTLVFTFVNPAQAGNYVAIITNSIGSVTSQVAILTVDSRPTNVVNISYLQSLKNANYALTDKTNLYQATGIVTTTANLVSGANYSFHIQDGTGGIDVFHRGGFAVNLPTAGDEVRVTAPLEQFNGLHELLPVGANPTHSLEILSFGNPLPAPLFFDFTTINPALMESTYEGRYVVVSNVFIGFTNTPPVVLSGASVFMTNLTGQVFRLFNPSPAIQPQGVGLPAFARSVRGVMTQTDGTSPFDSGYNMFLLDNNDVEAGVAPPTPIPLNIAQSGSDVVLTWSDPAFSLQAAPKATGTYTNVPGAVSGYTVPASATESYFRLAAPIP